MFEQYLIDIHAAQYVGTDDCMPDDFNDWLQEMDPEDMIRHADDFCQQEKEKLFDATVEQIKKHLRGEA